jgi:hypothetical protein
VDKHNFRTNLKLGQTQVSKVIKQPHQSLIDQAMLSEANNHLTPKLTISESARAPIILLMIGTAKETTNSHNQLNKLQMNGTAKETINSHNQPNKLQMTGIVR